MNGVTLERKASGAPNLWRSPMTATLWLKLGSVLWCTMCSSKAYLAPLMVCSEGECQWTCWREYSVPLILIKPASQLCHLSCHIFKQNELIRIASIQFITAINTSMCDHWLPKYHGLYSWEWHRRACMSSSALQLCWQSSLSDWTSLLGTAKLHFLQALHSIFRSPQWLGPFSLFSK